MINFIKKIKVSENHETLKLILGILLFSIILTYISLIISLKYLDLELMSFYFKQPLLVLINMIPIIIILTFLYALTNKSRLSFGITTGLFVTLSIISKLKMNYRGEPFCFADFNLVGEALKMTGRYNFNISYLIILMIIFLVILVILSKYFITKKISKRLRITIIIIDIILAILSFKYIYLNDNIYNKIGDKRDYAAYEYVWQYQDRGFIYSFLYSYKLNHYMKPGSYNEEEAINTLNNYSYTNIDKKVNIIGVMLESYNDFSKYADLNIDVYSKLKEIENEGISGRMFVDIFGGGTVSTERHVLTGLSNLPSFKTTTNSFVYYLDEQGYYTEFLHPYYGWFYNRTAINNRLGFDDFKNYDNIYSKIDSNTLSDKDFINQIINSYESATKPYFSFSVTFENHGPYSTKYNGVEYLKNNDSYDQNTYNMLNNYFKNINDTNEALYNLTSYFKEKDEPVVIIFFGDHNPALGTYYEGFNLMNMNMDINTDEGFYNYYSIPYVIWGNNEAKEVLDTDLIGDGDTISSNYLMVQLFDYLGYKGNQYMQYLSDLKEKINVMNNIKYEVNGDIVNDLPSNYLDIYNNY